MRLHSALAITMSSLLSLTTIACVNSASTHAVQSSQSVAEFSSTRMMQHLASLQNIAAANNNNRAVGTAGGLASAKYILDQVKAAGLTVQILPFENRNKKVGQNIIVEIQGQTKDTAIIVGGHYDSVEMGPGINDNASGVAVLLELIQHFKQQKQPPQHTLYFAFWDSEEDGIGGSQHFVKNLSAKQLEGIQAYINLDMVGTKDPTIQIADGDRSSIDEMEKMLKARGMAENDYKPVTDSLRLIPKHPKDRVLEHHLRHFFAAQHIQIKDELSTLTASDTAPFLGKVPVTSVIFFNEQMKGDELEFAPCYHKACDTIDLIDPKSMQIAGAAALSLINTLNASSQ